MKRLKDYGFIILLILFTVIATFFPLTGDDLFYFIYDADSFSDLVNMSSYGILTNLLFTVTVKFKLLRIIVYGIIATSMMWMLKTIVNKKNNVLMFIALFLFFMFDRNIFAASFVNTTGFVNHFIGSFFVITFLNIINKNLISRMNPIVLLFLGIIFTSINPVYSILIFIIALFYMLYMFKEGYHKGFFPLMVGMVCGLVLMTFSSSQIYNGISFNLLHKFIPCVIGGNFLITLILSSLLLFLSIKLLTRENRVMTCLSIVGIIAYLFVSLLSKSYIIHYIFYIIFFFATYFLFINVSKSRVFKRKISLYYFSKILFVLLSCIFGNLYEGSIILIFFIDIILIFELYNHLLPINFLELIWIVVILFVGVINIYIYNKVFYKYEEMNFYITNKLECSYQDFLIPNKYKNDYLYKLLPTNLDEVKLYIEYYGIDVYKENIPLKLEIREYED